MVAVQVSIRIRVRRLLGRLQPWLSAPEGDIAFATPFDKRTGRDDTALTVSFWQGTSTAVQM